MNITTAIQLSNAIKDARKQQGLSLHKTASTVGMKQDTVSKFEMSCANAQINTLFRLLSSLNLELDIKPRSQHLNSPPSNHSPQEKSDTDWNEKW